MNKFYNYLNTLHKLSLIFGIIFCCTVVGAIFGVPLLSASKKFKIARDSDIQEQIKMKKSLYKWTIYCVIVFFPWGLFFISNMNALNEYLENIIKNGLPNYNGNFESDETTDKNKTKKKSSKSIMEQQSKIDELKKIYDSGLIDDAEYDKLKKKILNN